MSEQPVLEIINDDELDYMEERIVPSGFGEYICYYYKSISGEVFACITCTLEEARNLRNDWLVSQLGY